jgi:hypothetical protein
MGEFDRLPIPNELTKSSKIMKLIKTTDFTFCGCDIHAMSLTTYFRINRTSDDNRNLVFSEDESYDWDDLPKALIKLVKAGIIESFSEERDAYRICILTKSIEDIW